MRANFDMMDNTPAPLLDETTIKDLTPTELCIARAIQGGGSGRGMSYYSSASRCGRRAVLSEARQKEFTATGSVGLPDTKQALVIGSIYHLLHQQLREPRADLVLDFTDSVYNVNVVEALRMFRGFTYIWGKDYWGKHIAVEHKLPSTAHGKKIVADTFGAEVTGTVDMVVEMSEEDALRCQRRVPGIRAGRYIVDWKTADGDNDGIALTLGLQTKWYPALWNLCFPERPVDGVIFDIAMKRGRRKDRAMYASDFQAVLVRDTVALEEAARVLKPMVEQGHLNVLNNRPNRAECVDWLGKICPFFKSTCDLEDGHDNFSGV